MATNRAPKRKRKAAGREIVRREAFSHLKPVVFEGEEFPDYIGMAEGYVDAVIAGLVIENQFVVKAAKRYRQMRKAAQKAGNPFWWSPEHAIEVCAFAERCPATTGGILKLEPCQCWWLIAIFGFREPHPLDPDAPSVRWVKEAHLETGRKQGKSAIGAVIDLYCFLYEGEVASQILLGASSRSQAGAVFKPIHGILSKEPDLRDGFGLKVTSKEVRRPDDGAFITTISAIGRKEDSHNPHVAHLDEVHAISQALYAVMRSSLGNRANQLFLKTTTAGHFFAGPGYDQRLRIERVLNGEETADRLFAVIYTIDAEDLKSPFKWENIIKANPLLGVTKFEQAFRDEIEEAKNNPFVRGEFIVKTLNFYAQTSERAFQSADWEACADPEMKLVDYVGRKCFVGIDLASRDDMAAIALIFEHLTLEDTMAVFVEHFTPEQAPGFYDERVMAHYHQWREQGHLKVTPGAILDFSILEMRIIEIAATFDAEAVVFDEAQHVQLIAKLHTKGIEAGAVRATPANLAEPTKDFMARVRACKVRHDGNPVLKWNIMNVRVQGSELPRPAKDKTAPHLKIDGASAITHANVARLSRVRIKREEPETPADPKIRTLDD
jgi:phage terminase large subunit-like protein